MSEKCATDPEKFAKRLRQEMTAQKPEYHMLEPLRGWTKAQKHAVAASYLGWTLDAFDFFLVVFVITDIAREFAVDVKSVTEAVFLTLAMRPLGAFIFGRLADQRPRPQARADDRCGPLRASRLRIGSSP